VTKQRVYGEDSPFSEWLRKQPGLPSGSLEIGVVATDRDMTIHVYKTPVDRMGSREVQSMIDIEVKTRGGGVSDSQRDTLYKRHRVICPDCKCKCIALPNGTGKVESLRHYGQAFVFLSGTDPDTSYAIWWGRFAGTASQEIRKTRITRKQLVDLLRFDLHPDSLNRNPHRRHHKNGEVEMVMKTELGFAAPHQIITRS
jgi:hypothetical protein